MNNRTFSDILSVADLSGIGDILSIYFQNCRNLGFDIRFFFLFGILVWYNFSMFCIFFIYKASRGAGAQSVTVKAIYCGFDPHSTK